MWHPESKSTTPPPPVKDVRLRGYIRDLNQVKLYCFIKCDDGKTFFLSFLGKPYRRYLADGVLVEFTPIANTAPGKLDRATNVIVLD